MARSFGYSIIRWLVCIGLVWSVTSPIQAQTIAARTHPLRARATPAPFFYFDELGKTDGVPGKIRKYYQDNTGLVWLAGDLGQGLTSFNGSVFNTYKNDPGNPLSVPSNSVLDVLDANNGLQWLATSRSVFVCNRTNGKYLNKPFIKETTFLDLFEDSKGRIWGGTDTYGLTLFDAVKDSMVTFPGKGVTNAFTGATFPESSFDVIKVITESPDGRIWAWASIYTPDGKSRSLPVSVDPDQRKLLFYPLPEDLKFTHFFDCFYVDQQQHAIWLAAETGELLRFSLLTQQLDRYPMLSKGDIFTAMAPVNGQQGQFWVSTHRGLFLADINHLDYVQISTETFTDIKTDQQGGTWMINNDGRIKRLSPDKQYFKISSELPDGFEAETMLTLPESGDLIQAAVDEKGNFETWRLKANTNQWQHDRQHISMTSLGDNTVTALFASDKNRIWVGLNSGIGWVNPQNMRLQTIAAPVLHDRRNLRTDQVWVTGLLPGEHPGDLFVITWNAGLIEYRAAENQWISHTYQLGGTERQLFNTSYRSVVRDRQGRIFLGSNGTGVECWQPATNQYRKYEFSDQTSRFIYAMQVDQNGQIWLGTEIGLVKFNPDAPAEQVFTPVQTPGGWVMGMVCDRQNQIWLKTAEGLILYDPATQSSRLLGEKQGMTVPFFDTKPLFLTTDTTLWYGSHLHFNPDQVKKPPFRGRPELAGLRIFDTPWHSGAPVEAVTHFEFTHLEHTLQFEFAALDYEVKPGQSRFMIKLDQREYGLFKPFVPGLWTDMGTQRSATFANLPPGSYQLHVLAGNADAGWAPESAAKTITFVIHPHWTDTWPFYLAIIITALGIVTGILMLYYRYRLREQQLEAEKQQREAERVRLELEKNAAVSEQQRKAAESEMKLLRSQLNPHFLFNAMNSINRYILENEKNKAGEYLAEFAQLTRSILDNSQHLVIPLSDELNMLERYIKLENLRFGQKITWTIDVADDIEPEYTQVPSMFMQPFVENAILHGLAPRGEGHIRIRIELIDQMLHCSIRDNGVGRGNVASHSGNRPSHASAGMRLINERLDAFAGDDTATVDIIDLTDKAGQPLGTEVVIRFPFVASI